MSDHEIEMLNTKNTYAEKEREGEMCFFFFFIWSVRLERRVIFSLLFVVVVVVTKEVVIVNISGRGKGATTRWKTS